MDDIVAKRSYWLITAHATYKKQMNRQQLFAFYINERVQIAKVYLTAKANKTHEIT